MTSVDQKSPDAFRTISEVAEWLDTPAHVLRFWESRFPQVKPVKRAGGRRYYRPSDMALLGGIKKLLHEDGMTIRGVQKLLRAEGVRRVAALSPPFDDIGAPMVEDAETEASQAEVLVLREQDPAPASPATPAPVEADAEDEKPEQPMPAAAVSNPQGELPFSPREADRTLEAELIAQDAAEDAALAPDAPSRAVEEPDEPEASPAPAAHDGGAQQTQPARGDQDFEAGLAAALGEALFAEPAPERGTAPHAPPARARPDLSGIPAAPTDDDPRFAPRITPFPLADPSAARARLAADPARASALYARLVDLRSQMVARAR